MEKKNKKDIIKSFEYVMEDEIQYETGIYTGISFAVTVCAFAIWLISPETWLCVAVSIAAGIIDIICMTKAQDMIDTRAKKRKQKREMIQFGLQAEGHVLETGSMEVKENYCKKLREKYKTAYKAKIEYYNEFNGTEVEWVRGLIERPKTGQRCTVYYKEHEGEYVSFMA